MSKYLEPSDENAFLDFVKKEKRPDLNLYFECPRCKGYGGWNLTINAYGEGKHFRCSCNHCNGWGYVDIDSVDHIHDWQFVCNLGRCYNRYKCSICDREWDIDSSD